MDPTKMSRLIAFVAEDKKTLKPVSFQPPGIHPTMLVFVGGDRFSIEKNELAHHPPLHRQGDETGKPAGNTVNYYGLSAGETGGWSLVAVRSEARTGRGRKPRR